MTGDSASKVFWFSEDELQELWNALLERKDLPGTKQPTELQSIYLELGVASVRSKWLRSETARIAVSLGYSPTTTPLYLSQKEIALLSSLPLASNIKEVLG